MIKMEIDEYNEKIKEISEKRRNAGKKGGAPKGNKNALKQTKQAKQANGCFVTKEDDLETTDSKSEQKQTKQAKQANGCFLETSKTDTPTLQNTHSTQETNKEKRSKKENKKEDYIPEEREKECVCKNAHAQQQPNLSTHTHTQASPTSTQTTNNEDNPKVKEYNSFVNWVKTTYPAYYGNENTVRMITGIQYSRLRMQYTKNQVARAMEELGANQKSIDERRYNEIYTPLRSYLERLTAK